jgi:NAD(P)-dependent dehydrogenase (short-subunit alcohol dehydrogenase family)
MTAQQRPAALITGGRRGIGRACAEELARRGFDVVVADVGAEGVEECEAAVRAAGAGFAFVLADVAREAEWGRLVSVAWDAFGGLECLVNNAGVSVASRGDLLDSDPADFDRVLAINLKAPFFLSIAVARRMIEAEAPRGHRTIINMASANATMVSPERGAYCLSKAAVPMLTQLFAVRLARHGITVHEIRPGVIRTEMTAVAKERYDARIAQGLSPIERWGEPVDVARAVAVLAAGDLSFMTGDALSVDGGLHLHRL